MDNYTANISDELSIIENKIRTCTQGDDKIYSVINKIVSAPSKKIRPIISVLYIKSLGLTKLTEEMLNIITAVELIHTASLIHDDVIDGSKFRRDVETINSEYDCKLAVISGDLLLTQAINLILDINSNKVFEFFIKTVQKMCLGEAKQYFLQDTIPTIDEYIQKSLYKTSELFNLSLKSCGLYIDNFDFKKADNFMTNFGIAFQIKNDLDSFLSQNSDNKNGIFTLPDIYMKELNNKDKAIEKTVDLMDNYLEQALKVIETVEENEYKRNLIGVINWIR